MKISCGPNDKLVNAEAIQVLHPEIGEVKKERTIFQFVAECGIEYKISTSNIKGGKNVYENIFYGFSAKEFLHVRVQKRGGIRIKYPCRIV